MKDPQRNCWLPSLEKRKFSWKEKSFSFTLGAVLGAGLLAVGHTLGIKHAADDVVANPGQVANAAAAHQDDGVLLEVVAFPGNVGGDLDAVGKSDAGHLAQGGVGLLGRHDLDLQTDPAFLRAALQGRMFGPAVLLPARLAHQLIDRRHLPNSRLAKKHENNT